MTHQNKRITDKDWILAEIKRTAKDNGGVVLGMEKFEKQTGIKRHTWYGIYWRGWGEAVREAGFSENKFGSTAYGEAFLIEKLAELARTLGRFPAQVDIKLAKRQDASFPSLVTFNDNLGSPSQKIEHVRRFVSESNQYADVLDLLPPPEISEEALDVEGKNSQTKEGFVYLGMLKIDTKKRYKIGKTNLVERRNTELSLQLPEKLELVHYIKTDDMSGIETYWHKRFADKNTNGEWFELTSGDVRAFKLRKFM